jgi:hypothetical protein
MNRRDTPGRSERNWGLFLTILACVLLAVIALAYNFFFTSQAGIRQPIPFSHKFHVTEKSVSCIFCHPTTLSTSVAGIPPLETCMLCHKQIIVTFPNIMELQKHYYSLEPVKWKRVNYLPDFVFFNHQMHVRSGFDCGICHGNVAQMDRVVPAYEFTMGFCIKCHEKEKTSVDCLICHR